MYRILISFALLCTYLGYAQKQIEGGNTTYTLRPYKNLNHNFFEIKDGKPDRKSGQWTQVMTDALDWLKK